MYKFNLRFLNKLFEMFSPQLTLDLFSLFFISLLYVFSFASTASSKEKNNVLDWCLKEAHLPCGFTSKAEALEKGSCTINRGGKKGGYVAFTAKVEKTFFLKRNLPFIGPEVEVCDQAQVMGKSKILDKAKIRGNAKIYSKAQVKDNAEVYGEAIVSSYAKISGTAQVFGNAVVSTRAKVTEEAKVYDWAYVHKAASVLGSARIYEHAEVRDQVEVTYDVYGNTVISEKNAHEVNSSHPRPIPYDRLSFSNLELEFENHRDHFFQRRTSSPSLTAKDDEWVVSLTQKGIKFQDVITGDPLTSVQEMLEEFQTLFHMKNFNKEELLQFLKRLDLAFSFFHKQKLVDFTLPIEEQLKNLQVNPQNRIVNFREPDYQKLLKELPPLKEGEDPYIEMFKILSQPEVLYEAKYLDPEDECFNQDSQMKIDNLIQFLASIKREETGTQKNRQLSDSLVANTEERYDSEGMPKSWLETMQYKFRKVYDRIQHIDQLQEDPSGEIRVSLANLFLHGGKHCSDAKWNMMDEAYQTLCPFENRAWEGELNSRFTPLKKKIFMTYAQLRSNILAQVIQDEMKKMANFKEGHTYFLGTWNRYANLFGLTKKENAYRNTFSFDHRDLVKLINPKSIFVFTKKQLRDQLTDQYLGPLAKLPLSNGNDEIVDYLVLGFLLTHGILEPLQK